jgi:hypothetical protein
MTTLHGTYSRQTRSHTLTLVAKIIYVFERLLYYVLSVILLWQYYPRHYLFTVVSVLLACALKLPIGGMANATPVTEAG